jgi:hypothetical protein
LGESESIDLERAAAPIRDYLGDRTLADAYLQFKLSKRIHGVVVETKLADQFSSRHLGIHLKKPYLGLNRKIGLWKSEEMAKGFGRVEQLARVHAIGAAISNSAPTVLVLHHDLDHSTPKAAEAYRRTLLEPTRLHVVSLTRFAEVMSLTAVHPTDNVAATRISRRYCAMNLSAEHWARRQARSP